MKLPLLTDHGDSGSLVYRGGTGAAVGDDIRHTTVGEAFLENWYLVPSKKSKASLTLLPTPGFTKTALTPTGGTGCRGGIDYDPDAGSNATFINIVGNSLYRGSTKGDDLNSAYSHTEMATNYGAQYAQILITTSSNPYVYNIEYQTLWRLTDTQLTTGTANGYTANKLNGHVGETFTTDGVKAGMTVYNSTDDTYAFITNVDSQTVLSLSSDIFPLGTETYEIRTSYGLPFSGSKACAYFDGYFIVDDQSDSSTGRFYISAKNDASRWNALDFATAERNSDKIEAIKVVKRELWLIGSKSTEAWYNAGGADFPFAPIPSGYMSVGTSNYKTVRTIDDNVLMATEGGDNRAEIVINDGYSFKPISTIEVQADISSTYDATKYQDPTGRFYVLTFASYSGGARTVVFNLDTGFWHRWRMMDGTNEAAPYVMGSRYAGSHRNENSYLNFLVSRTEDNNTIERICRSPAIHNDNGAINYRAVEIDAAPESFYVRMGAGTTGTTLIDTTAKDFTTLGITDGTDYIETIDGTQIVITTVDSATQMTMASSVTVNHLYKIMDGTTNTQIYPDGLSLRWRKNSGSWTTKKTRYPDSGRRSRFIWRKCGRDYTRTFEISTSSAGDPILQSAYALIDD